MKIWIIRHGESKGNVERICRGITEDSLTSRGEKESCITGRYFSGQGIDFDRIYCSPNLRARQTLNHFLLGLNSRREHKIVYDERLVELDFGVCENMYWEDVIRHYGKADEEVLFRSTEQSRYPGGESLGQFLHRSRSFLNDLKQQKHENVLVITHGFTEIMLRIAAEDKNTKSFRNTPWSSNCNITLLQANHENKLSVKFARSSQHLDVLEKTQKAF
jgi:alpha-ribazole phosphatase